MTSSIMENGIQRFYTSLTSFQRKLFARAFQTAEDEDEDGDYRALSMTQLKRPMMLIFGLWVIAICIFCAEIALSKCMCRILRR